MMPVQRNCFKLNFGLPIIFRLTTIFLDIPVGKYNNNYDGHIQFAFLQTGHTLPYAAPEGLGSSKCFITSRILEEREIADSCLWSEQ